MTDSCPSPEAGAELRCSPWQRPVQGLPRDGPSDVAASDRLRFVLSHYPTGVVAVTSISEAEPLGIAVGSFTSVSLDPPLVGFLPAKTSETWPKIKPVGRFAVNVLGRHQEEICRALSRKADKFVDVSWRPGVGGCPIIDDAVAWIECDLHSVTEAGDHYFVLGEVRHLNVGAAADPLVFYRSAYGGYHGLTEVDSKTN